MDDVDGSSPLSSCSDNSDAVNTSSAKVYFGPVQSPEKKFAPLLSPCKPSTHDLDNPGPFLLRRSPRLSSPAPNEFEEDDKYENEQEQEADNSAGKGVTNIWQGTPLQQFLSQDEPSSAIANRIIRAHDNPSPPPKALRPPSTTPRTTSKLANELVFPSMDSSEESSDAVVEALLPSTTGMSLSPSPPRDVLMDFPSRDRSGSPTPRRSSRRRLSATPQPEEADLISFDRSLSVATEVPVPIIHSPSPQLATKPGQTVDDLLFPSPPCITVQDESQIPEDATVPITDALCTAGNLLDPAPSTPPRRRSPRLSALPLSPSPGPPNSTEETPRARSPRVSDVNQRSARSRKRFRNGSEKIFDGNLLSPVRGEWATDSDVTDNESDREPSPKRKKRMKDSFDSRQGETNLQFTESLSPESARILMSLASPDTKCKSPLIPEIDMDRPSTPKSESVPPSLNVSDVVPQEPLTRPPSSAQRPPPGTFNLMYPASPVKLTLTPALDNPNRTPARRVRINPDGNVQSAANVGAVYTPVFSRPPVGDPSRTPARRIPISESQSTNIDRQPKSPGPSFLSPSKTSTLGQKAGIHDTSSTAFTSTQTRPATFIKPSALDKKRTVSGSNSGSDRLPSSSTSSTKTAPLSTLPSIRRGPDLSQATSRIPRIGSAPKPGASSRTSKLPMPSHRNLNVPNALPTRLPSPAKPQGKPLGPTNSSSGSDDSSTGLSLHQGAPTNGIARGIHMTAKAKQRQSGKRASPPRPIRARLVVPGMFGGPGKKPASIQPGKPDVSLPQTASPTKSTTTVLQGPLKAREVVKGTLTKFELREPSSKLIESYTEAREREKASVAAAGTAEPSTQLPITHVPSLDAFTFHCPAAQSDEALVVENESQALEPGAPSTPILPPVLNSDEMAIDEDEPSKSKSTSKSSGSRRSSRTRKPIQADVFGTVTPVASSSSAPRRKPGKGPPQSAAPGNIVFFINGASLKNLTNNNTTRNQHYHTELETLIVRKSGNRPESPTMKLRTIAEKQKEEQTKMRAERARRRQMGDWISADGDSSMDVDLDSSVTSEPVRHRRGPGDEEDYVTPMKPENAGKRVKWDHGLETTVFLDEIELQPERRKIAERIVPRKSCLVFDPDKVPIDDLGNAANANAPLKLMPEKVVVTKYVYDNDLVVEEVEQPRSTRSKSKKKS